MPKHEPEVPKFRKRGRPPGPTKAKAEREKTLREIALTYAPEMINVLASVAMDEEQVASARVSAANSLLNRAYGQPAVAKETEADSPDNVVRQTAIEKLKGLSDATLEEIARAEAKAKAKA